MEKQRAVPSTRRLSIALSIDQVLSILDFWVLINVSIYQTSSENPWVYSRK